MEQKTNNIPIPVIDYWLICGFVLGIVGVVSIIIYSIRKKDRRPELDELFNSFLSFTSFPPALKLCWAAMINPLLSQIEVDRSYVFIGGLAIIWLSVDAIISIVKRP